MVRSGVERDGVKSEDGWVGREDGGLSGEHGLTQLFDI